MRENVGEIFPEIKYGEVKVFGSRSQKNRTFNTNNQFRHKFVCKIIILKKKKYFLF